MSEDGMAEAQRLGLMTASGNPTARVQCPTCERVFSTVTNFDRHLSKGRSAEDFTGQWCRDPSTVGLIQDPGGWWKQRPTEGFRGGAAVAV